MKQMKRISAAVAALVIATGGLVACSGGGDDDKGSVYFRLRPLAWCICNPR